MAAVFATLGVALRAGAWIETRSPQWPAIRTAGRPPCGGVDRNTSFAATCLACDGSPSVRGRGSKQGMVRRRWPAPGRPPCGGVDRNTSAAGMRSTIRRRPPCGGVDRNPEPHPNPLPHPGRPPCGGVDRNSASAAVSAATLPSPSVRGRGSKPDRGGRFRQLQQVALRAGAWIETTVPRRTRWAAPVALRAGAWIETLGWLPSYSRCLVALRAGAWIETCPGAARRGSWPVALRAGAWIETTGISVNVIRSRVALRAGAWIETPKCWGADDDPASPSVRGRGSKLRGGGMSKHGHKSPSVRGRGSKPYLARLLGPLLQRRPPCGGVDRN